jgi:hypothetical protein
MRVSWLISNFSDSPRLEKRRVQCRVPAACRALLGHSGVRGTQTPTPACGPALLRIE